MLVYVQNRFEGFHRWKDAPEEVKFLRSVHRHIFYVKTTVSVNHAERDVEFFILQHKINEIIDSWKNLDTVDWSCETMATEILKQLSKQFPNRYMSCEVSEDQENGAIVEFGNK